MKDSEPDEHSVHVAFELCNSRERLIDQQRSLEFSNLSSELGQLSLLDKGENLGIARDLEREYVLLIRFVRSKDV